MPLNQWNHLAIGRDESSSWFILLNGASYSLSTSTSGTVTWTDNYSFNAAGMGAAATSPLNINGIATSQGITGYYSDMRFVNGVAIYNTTTNLGPPTQPLTLIGTTQTVLLLNGRPGGIIDATGKNNLTTVGGAKISQAVFKYGTGSISFNGTTDYLSIPTNPALNLSTGDFTIECWLYRTTSFADSYIISSSGSGGMFFGFFGATIIGYGRAVVAWDYQSAAHGMSLNTWYHLALTRNGTSIRIFVNGVQVGVTQTSSQAYDLGVTSTTIGSQGAAYYHGGYIDDLRVTKGIARYTATFTPPTAALSTGTYIQMA
jgi:hypothetical protein